VDHLQYLAVMVACVVATLPLELLFGARVWRRPGRLARVLVAPVVIFCLWDVAAIEEVVFFVVVPVCALLTFEVVSRMLGPDRHLPLLERLAPGVGRRLRARRSRS
jgi:hypothetical protein